MIGPTILGSLSSSGEDHHGFAEHRVHTAGQRAADKCISVNELRASALATRQARRQLLRVSWNPFHKAYEEYPRWQGLSLWTRAVVACHEQTPAEVLGTLRKHCPEFVESEVFVCEPNLMDFRLLEWVHNTKFGDAKEQGWLDALTFYGVRHLRSRAVWDYWEHCENGPGRMSSIRFPPFDEWWQSAMEMKLCGGISCQEIGPGIQKFTELEAMSMWLHPLVTADIRLTKGMLSELEGRLPGMFSRSDAAISQGNTKPSTWLSAIRTSKKRLLKEAQEAGCLDWLTELLQYQPRFIRLRAYARHCEQSRPRICPRRYPSFQDWRKAADHYFR